MSVTPVAKRLVHTVFFPVREIRVARRSLEARRSARRLTRAEGKLSVCYVTRAFPTRPPDRTELAVGGAVKLTYLSERFAHAFPKCNVLYVVSSLLDRSKEVLIRIAQARGIRCVLNQNGVYYGAWYGRGWQRQNVPLAAFHSAADFVIYQSRFCQQSAVRFLGQTPSRSEVLYNPVDLTHYAPRPRVPVARGPILLALGSCRDYRMKAVVDTLAEVRRQHPAARLLIPGLDAGCPEDARTMQRVQDWAAQAGLSTSAIEVAPRYTRQEAPAVFGRAHILLHPTYNDASPNVVVEALACGLPVAYSASGGLPELVGPYAGVGVPAPLDWERMYPPAPADLAAAVCQILENWDRYSRAARQAAGDRFDLAHYLGRHEAIFTEVFQG